MSDDDFDKTYEDIIRTLYDRASREPQPARPQGRRQGNYLMSRDGKFLGRLTSNRFDKDSIFNEFGPYGSKFRTESIFNTFGPYGSKFSTTSPWNPFAQSPPEIYLNGQKAGVLTKNRFLPGAKDPDEFLKEVRENPRFSW